MVGQLVTLRKVHIVLPIKGTSDLVLATIDGWKSAVKPGSCKKGEFIIYFKDSSFLPATKPAFADLPGQTIVHGKQGVLVRPQTIHGQVSQGLVLPISTFPDVQHVIDAVRAQFPDDEDSVLSALRNIDIARLLGVKEFAPVARGEAEAAPKDTAAPAKGSSSSSSKQIPGQAGNDGNNNNNTNKEGLEAYRPKFCKKPTLITAQEIESLFLRNNKDTVYSVTTLMVGEPMSVYFLRKDSPYYGKLRSAVSSAKAGDLTNGHLGVCSRSVELLKDDAKNLHWGMVKKYGLQQKLDAANKSIVIHGVLCGSSIRGNREGFEEGEHDFFVYAVGHPRPGHELMAPAETWKWVQDLGLQQVPLHADAVALCDIAGSHDDLVEVADGPSWLGRKRAGLVLRNVETGRAFKVLSKDYLDYYGIRADSRGRAV